uniref:hypothetical protein n=1 Tax=Komagataeibacter xylinus TaxID=28448 RepID=UPI0011DE26CD|nr:hypothetical protein [Komagataeibacter xylinus]
MAGRGTDRGRGPALSIQDAGGVPKSQVGIFNGGRLSCRSVLTRFASLSPMALQWRAASSGRPLPGQQAARRPVPRPRSGRFPHHGQRWHHASPDRRGPGVWDVRSGWKSVFLALRASW